MMHMATRAMGTANDETERTCCNCWHIKHGTVFLGLFELLGVVLLLSGIVNKIIWKNNLSQCRQTQSYFSRLFDDCLLRNFSHFDWTLAGDYVLALLLTLIFLCILLLFLGIMKKSPTMLLPHLIVQGICLVFSLVYFILYAWSYFYGDLYVQKNEFRLQSMLERMWLASLLLLLAAFQFYLFFTVIKCCLYLQTLRNARLRRSRQFEECSKRVRDAKQNGLWRSTSWGGGFQEYKGQYDEGNHWKKKRDKPTTHVKWNLQANREKSVSNADESLQEAKQNPPSPTLKSNASTPQQPSTSKPKISSLTTPHVIKSASSSEIKTDRNEVKGKDGLSNVAIDMQINDSSVRPQPIRHKTVDSPKPHKSNFETRKGYSVDSSSVDARRTHQDVKQRSEESNGTGEQTAHTAYSVAAALITEKASDKPHHRHQHHRHQYRQDTANSTGPSSPVKQLSVVSEPPIAFTKNSIAISGSHSSSASQYPRDIP